MALKLQYRIAVCLAALLAAVFFPAKEGIKAAAQDSSQGNIQRNVQKNVQKEEDEKYFKSLPDQSFAVIEKDQNGALIRLLPHHDERGKLVIPWLEESMNQIFKLDPNHRIEAREHLLKDYYEINE